MKKVKFLLIYLHSRQIHHRVVKVEWRLEFFSKKRPSLIRRKYPPFITFSFIFRFYVVDGDDDGRWGWRRRTQRIVLE